jgi:hypothetical protein
VVLCEDSFHVSFANSFLSKSNIDTVGKARIVRAGNKKEVFRQFPIELRALRTRHPQTRLIVLIDADELTDQQIHARFREEVKEASVNDGDYSNDPVIIIRPRWELENWALHLLGESIGEVRDPGSNRKAKERVRDAARVLADRCHSRNLPPPSLPSLEVACREWLAHREHWKY